MTTEQIQAALAELVTAMMGKGVVTPSAEYTIKSQSGSYIWLWSSYDTKAFNGEYMHHIVGETPAELLANARAYIDAMPSPEQAAITRHMGLLAAVVEHGREHSLPDEYVVPAQVALQAMTDNLLTVQP